MHDPSWFDNNNNDVSYVHLTGLSNVFGNTVYNDKEYVLLGKG